jgi:hypothetical protein
MDIITEAIIATASTVGTYYNYVKSGSKYIKRFYTQLKEKEEETEEVFNNLEKKLRERI